MLKPKDLAKGKKLPTGAPRVNEANAHYNHETQVSWTHLDKDSLKTMMKCSTQFDGETDSGGDDR